MANTTIGSLPVTATAQLDNKLPAERAGQTVHLTVQQLVTLLASLDLMVPGNWTFSGTNTHKQFVGMLGQFLDTPPSGWLLLHGQSVSRTTYADLFALWGTTYGAGDGSTTFGLPDMRGRVAVGRDDMGGVAANRVTSAGSGIDGTTLGATGGSEDHTLTEAQMPSHAHTVSANRTNTTSATGSTNRLTYMTSGDTGNNASDSTSTGGDEAHPNMPPAMIVNYCVYAGA